MRSQLIKSTLEVLKASDGPFYIYDLDLIPIILKELREFYQFNGDIFFSMKSNPHPRVISALHQQGCHFDVSSASEYLLLKNMGIPASKVTVSGPAKTDEFLKMILNFGANCIHLDSMEEWQVLEKTDLAISLRISLEETFSRKLGLSERDIHQVLSRSIERISGFHIYLGRERGDEKLVKHYINKIENFIQSYPRAFPDEIRIFWGAGVASRICRESNHTPQSIPHHSRFKVSVEVGRALSQDLGGYCAQVLAVKEKSGLKFIIIDGGLQHTATYFSSPKVGQQGLNTLMLSSEENGLNEMAQFDVYGSLGIYNDHLIRQVQLPKHISSGDWLFIYPAGAYGYSASANQFIGPQPVREYFILNNELVEGSVLPKTYLNAGIARMQNGNP